MAIRKVDATWTQQPPRAVGPGLESSTAAPARPAAFVSDVIVPLVQAVVTGALLAGLCVFLLSELVAVDLDGLKVWAGLTLGISALSWLWLLGQTRRLLWAVEKLTGLDLDGDQVQGHPQKRTIDVSVRENGNDRIIGADWLGINDENLIAFAAGVIGAGKGFTEGEWGKSPSFPQGINQFRAVKAKLLTAGLIEKINPNADNSTCRLTASGRAVFGRLAELSHTHTHEQGV